MAKQLSLDKGETRVAQLPRTDSRIFNSVVIVSFPEAGEKFVRFVAYGVAGAVTSTPVVGNHSRTKTAAPRHPPPPRFLVGIDFSLVTI